MNIKRIILSFSLSFLFLACFFIFMTALTPLQPALAAAAVYDVEWLDTGNGQTHFGRDYIFQKFVPLADSIAGLELYFTGASAVINLCQGALDTDNLLNNHVCANSALIASTTCSTSARPFWDSGFSDCPFSASAALVPGADYYYEIIGVWTQASGLYNYAYPGQTCGVQADGSSPYCLPRNHYNGFMARNNLRTYSLPSQLDPVIIIPGIMGSWKVSGKWELDPILHTYDNLMEALMAAGYKEPSILEPKGDLFVFPYDWRQDNILTADLLKQKIQEVKQITGRDKVDIIAHSMGGLIARSYIQGSDYQNDIDQLLFLGAPHKGSPESYLKYEGAFFQSNFVPVQKYFFQTEAALNGYLDLTDYIRVQVPAVEQLLPIYDYLKDKQADNSWQVRAYPLNYPQNNYLENLNRQVNTDLLKQRANIINIISDLGNASTLNYLRVIADPDTTDNKWQSGYPENLAQSLDSLEMGSGDNTVPFSSASSLTGVETIESASADHTNLSTIMQKEIIKTLTGKQPTDYFNSKITSTIKRWFFFRVYSPVDFSVIAPDGKKIGKDFLNNTAINQIPDAFYSGFDSQTEFVLIPNPMDGEYKVELGGVANGGEYTLAGSVIDNNTETSREFSGSIAPAEQRDFNITYSVASENHLSEIEPVDTVLPIVTINKPIAGEKYLHSDNLLIDYTATDDFSGLATTTIMIDGQTVATTTVDLFDYSLGAHNLTITAIDKAGNQAEKQVSFEIIANIDSTISDIKEIYERGWLTDRIYEKLLKNALKLLKIEAKYFDREQELTEKLRKKIQDNDKLTDKQKQKLIEQYNKKLVELKKNRAKAINRSLDSIVRLLNKAKDKSLINQAGYDIILGDINYLRENL